MIRPAMIRPMREEDIPAVARLEAELFGKGAWSENMVAEEFHGPSRHYIVYDTQVFADDAMNMTDTQSESNLSAQVVAYAGYWWDGDDAELMTIGVAVPWQGRGIAGALLDTLIRDARAHGARRMILEVRVDNDPALALYRGRGFYRMGVRRRYYQPENKDAYTMALDLVPRTVGFNAPTNVTRTQ